MADEKVLLVDDEVEFIEALAERMEARGLRVSTASSGEEALQRAQSGGFDAIVLDLSMPGMDGIETLKALLAEHPELQVILLTGYGSIPKSVEALKLGAVDFLEKPAKLDELMEKIREAGQQRLVLLQEKMEGTIRDVMEKKSW